jgi:hypothetical protein
MVLVHNGQVQDLGFFHVLIFNLLKMLLFLNHLYALNHMLQDLEYFSYQNHRGHFSLLNIFHYLSTMTDNRIFNFRRTK